MNDEERLIYAAAYVHGGKNYASARLSDYRKDLAEARTRAKLVGGALLLEFAGLADVPIPCPACRAIAFPLPDGKCRGCGFQRTSRS